MVSARRTTDNFGLQHALYHAETLGVPLVVFEPLRVGYRWASERFHAFVLEGMRDNAEAFDGVAGVTYLPYVEPEAGAGSGLLEALAAQACMVVSDHFPCFFVPRMVDKAAKRLDVQVDVVDSNGILPLFAAPREFTTAHSFRRHVHKNVLEHLAEMPEAEPLASAELPPAPARDALNIAPWAACTGEGALNVTLSALPIDHSVTPVSTRGGRQEAWRRLDAFLGRQLNAYGERNQVERDIGTGLSPHLHFGHIGAHTILRELIERERWSPDQVAPKPTGSRAGWWGMSEGAESFLDQVLTWRELGYTFCHVRWRDYDRFESLPPWALTTLEAHARDRRPVLYDFEALDAGKTHDMLWNAAQRQLRREGMIHNYLRMLWAKKILEWTEHPRVALDTLIELNNRYALDGRDPNSYSGIFWCLGRFDRAWGPERPIFGKIRYMSSENTARKVRVGAYIARYS
uniref:Deoxyribodipyrimidine photo-lyase n=1 Tax=uncultured bacterium HF186_25m_13D19 TaxID=662888 RepID=C7FPH9_9BACT|nr:deoxyribodipyrimidine photolyase [uncultured bacterium HF186_25m_13D19]